MLMLLLSISLAHSDPGIAVGTSRTAVERKLGGPEAVMEIFGYTLLKYGKAAIYVDSSNKVVAYHPDYLKYLATVQMPAPVLAMPEVDLAAE